MIYIHPGETDRVKVAHSIPRIHLMRAQLIKIGPHRDSFELYSGAVGSQPFTIEFPENFI
jgi:hypothetical protein